MCQQHNFHYMLQLKSNSCQFLEYQNGYFFHNFNNFIFKKCSLFFKISQTNQLNQEEILTQRWTELEGTKVWR